MPNEDPTERKASLGYEKELWEAADLLRSNMDPAEYKHVVLGLLFLKYLSDAFEDRREDLRQLVANLYQGTRPQIGYTVAQEVNYEKRSDTRRRPIIGWKEPSA